MIEVDKSVREKILKIGEKFKDANVKIATAESCTGGLIGAMLTSVKGSSDWFAGGIISYSNEIKNKVLKVADNTLNEFGAVSENTVKEMAMGAAKVLDADITISVSGIAGPGGGSVDKPVGLVYIGLYNKGKVSSFRNNFSGDRNKIRELTVLKSLDILLHI